MMTSGPGAAAKLSLFSEIHSFGKCYLFKCQQKETAYKIVSRMWIINDSKRTTRKQQKVRYSERLCGCGRAQIDRLSYSIVISNIPDELLIISVQDSVGTGL